VALRDSEPLPGVVTIGDCNDETRACTRGGHFRIMQLLSAAAVMPTHISYLCPNPATANVELNGGGGGEVMLVKRIAQSNNRTSVFACVFSYNCPIRVSLIGYSIAFSRYTFDSMTLVEITHTNLPRVVISINVSARQLFAIM